MAFSLGVLVGVSWAVVRSGRPDAVVGWLVDSRIDLGELLATQGRHRDARAQYRAVLEFAPSHALAHNNLGNSLLAAERLDEAVRHLETAVAGSAEAEVQFRRAIGIDPDLAAAHRRLGSTLVYLGRENEALAALERAVQLAPDDPIARANRDAVARRRPAPQAAALDPNPLMEYTRVG